MRQPAPDRGDLVWVSFDPQAGREQAGRRPALVLSPRTYNVKVGLALCCPITSVAKGYPFEVALPTGTDLNGVVLSDQVKSLDWRARRLEIVGRLSRPAIADVLGKLSALLRDRA